MYEHLEYVVVGADGRVTNTLDIPVPDMPMIHDMSLTPTYAVVYDLPGVGKNLQDHMDVYLTAETTPVSYNSSDRPHKALLAGLQYITTKTGPITASVCEAGMFVRSGPDVATPDIQMHALPAYVIDHGRMRIKGHGMTINTCHLRPRSIGSVA